jgi:hypothetical protein
MVLIILISTILLLSSFSMGSDPVDTQSYFNDNLVYAVFGNDSNIPPDCGDGDDHEAIKFCLTKFLWLQEKVDRNDSILYIPKKKNTCDMMMADDSKWEDKDAILKSSLTDCGTQFLIALHMRDHYSELYWVPSSLFHNSESKSRMFHDVEKCKMISLQHEMDQNRTLSEFLSEDYKKFWEASGLNVIHYNKVFINDDARLATFKGKVDFDFYVTLNRNLVESCVPYKELSKMLSSNIEIPPKILGGNLGDEIIYLTIALVKLIF